MNGNALYYPKINDVAEIIRYHSSHNPDVAAIICEDRLYTYFELNQVSNRISKALLDSGISKFARVAYLGKESEKYYALLFACAKIGAVLVPINWRLVADEVSHILSDSGAIALLVDPELKARVDSIRDDMSSLKLVVYLNNDLGSNELNFDAWISGYPTEDLQVDVTPQDSIALLYTSGTTGLPKGVELAHRSFFKIRDSLNEKRLSWIDWKIGDRSLIGIPGFHIGGLWWAIQGFSAGITNVSMPVFFPRLAVEILETEKITTACFVPAMIHMILHEKDPTQADYNSVRKIVYGGSPISESLLDRGLKAFQCDFAQIYGLTETGNTAVCLPPEDHRPGTRQMIAAGKPYPCVSLKIIDEQGNSLVSDLIGEICIRTPAHMKGYWGLQGATESTLVDGWIHTGDAGYVDKDGYLYVCDRIKDTIIVAGENIYPAEIENILTKHPAVSDAAIIGVPDERWGEAVYAFIVKNKNERVSARELFLFVKDKIADFKVPSQFEFIETIPRNPSGKILRRLLREPFWQDKARNVN